MGLKQSTWVSLTVVSIDCNAEYQESMLVAKNNHKLKCENAKRKIDKNLEDGNGEGGSFSSTGLSLSDHIPALDDRLDSALLDRRRLLKTISIDAPEGTYLMEEKYT